MKRYRNKTFKFSQDIDKSYQLLYGPTTPAGCAICGEDEPSVLDIHKADDSNDFKVLCDKCYGVTSQSFDKKLQKQVGGSYV